MEGRENAEDFLNEDLFLGSLSGNRGVGITFFVTLQIFSCITSTHVSFKMHLRTFSFPP